MLFLFRILWFVVAVFILRWILAKLFLPNPSRQQPPLRQSPEVRGTARKDPQCGIYVAEELAVTAVVNGQPLYFCSTECRDRFLADRRADE